MIEAADSPSPEPIARFLRHRNHFSREENRVTERAFLPGRDGATSVFCVEGLTESGMWTLAESNNISNFHGAGIVNGSDVREAGLLLARDDDPPRHASIVGWPTEKDARKSMAQDLASRASLRLR